MITTPVFAVPVQEKFLVYFPLRRAAFLASPAAVNFIDRLSQAPPDPDDWNPDQKSLAGLLDLLGVLDPGGDPDLSGPETDPFHPTSVTLLLTSRCNLACKYCYAAPLGSPDNDMTPEMAFRAVDFAARNAQLRGEKEFFLGFHGGGEPLLNWDTFEKSVLYAEQTAGERGLEVRVRAATNGVFGREKLDFILEHAHGLVVSVDGAPPTHDLQRPKQGGGPSSPLVLANLDALAGAGFSFAMRMTVTAQSVEELPQNVGFLLERGYRAPIMAEPVYGLGLGRGMDVDPDRFYASFCQARNLAAAKGGELEFSPARAERLSKRFCGACSGNFCLTAAGHVTACYQVFDPAMEHGERFFVGRWDREGDDFLLDPNRLAGLSGLTVENIPWCEGCFARYHCAGDCPHLAAKAAGDGPFQGHPRCEITRHLIKDRILENIRRAGGLFWKED